MALKDSAIVCSRSWSARLDRLGLWRDCIATPTRESRLLLSHHHVMVLIDVGMW